METHFKTELEGDRKKAMGKLIPKYIIFTFSHYLSFGNAFAFMLKKQYLLIFHFVKALCIKK